jgi:hypothetical protein
MVGSFLVIQLERMWKEGAVVYFMILSEYLLGATKENHEQLSKCVVSVDLDTKPCSFEYKREC